MLRVRRRLLVATVGAVMGISAGAMPALAWVCPPPEPPPPTSKSNCNAGNGNGSEPATATCIGGDPGKSFAAGNRGGDEGGTPVPNPGGNNVP